MNAYEKQRHHEILKISFLLLLERLALLIVLIVNFALRDGEFSNLRILSNSAGVLLHFALLVSLLSKISLVQRLHAPLVLCTNLFFLINHSLQFDEVIATFGQQLLIISAVVILNQCWLMTSASIIVTLVAQCYFLGF